MSHYTVIKIQCTHSVCDVSTYNQKQRRLLHNITHYDCMHSVTPGLLYTGQWKLSVYTRERTQSRPTCGA